MPDGPNPGGGPARAIDGRVNVLAGAWVANTFAYSIAHPFLPLYLNGERGFPMGDVGLVFAAIGLARAASPMAAGFVVDRIGRRTVLVAGPLVRSVFFFALAHLAAREASLAAITVAVSLATFAGGFFQCASDAYLADITGEGERSEAFSRVRVGLNVGWATGPAVGAYLARTPFSMVFAITGAVCVLLSIISFALLPETPAPQWRDSCAAAGERDRGTPAAEEPSSFARRLASDRGFVAYLACAFLFFLTSSQLVTNFSAYSTAAVGVGRNVLGHMYAMNGIIVIALLVPASRALARFAPWWRLAAGAVLCSAGYFAVGLSRGAPGLFLAVAIFTAGELFTSPLLGSVASRMAPPGMVGRYMGTFQLVMGLGYSLGPYLGALLYERLVHAPGLLWAYISLGALLAAGGFAFMRRNRTMRADGS
jgi:MFS family permease